MVTSSAASITPPMPAPGPRRRPLAGISGLVGAASAILVATGLVVLTGWHQHLTALTRVLPGAIPMQYNTALCFIVLGATTWAALAAHARKVTAMGATALVVAGSLVLYEYVTNRLTGFDTLFFTPWDTRYATHPGQMALTTATCFVLAGGGLGLAGRAKRSEAFLATHAVVPLGLGAASLLGHALGVTYVLPFRLGSQMAVHTAGCWVVWGAATIAVAWRREKRLVAGVPRWMPLVAALATGLFLLGFSFALKSDAGLAGLAQAVIGAAVVALVGLTSHQVLTARGNAETERDRLEREVAHRTQTLTERTAELEAANEKLRTSDRHKDEFLSVISHELRTPLNFITGFASILEEETRDVLTPDQLGYIERITSGADRMLVLVNDLLDAARLQTGRVDLYRDEVPLALIVEDAIESLRPLAERNDLRLTTEVPRDLPYLFVDASRILQVLTNLVANAVKFTPSGGSVTVRAILEGEFVRAEVIDTGKGIAEADQAHLFERFYQADMSTTRTAGGTGLGLSIAKAIIEAHGGTIGVVSTPGEGACFWFTLPIAEPDPSA